MQWPRAMRVQVPRCRYGEGRRGRRGAAEVPANQGAAPQGQRATQGPRAQAHLHGHEVLAVGILGPERQHHARRARGVLRRQRRGRGPRRARSMGEPRLRDPRGFGIEVKSTAYIQTWAHGTLSQITFDVSDDPRLDPTTNKLRRPRESPLPDLRVRSSKPSRSKTNLDMLDASSVGVLRGADVVARRLRARGGKSVSLATLQASKDFGTPVSYRALAARIGKVAGLAEA